MASIYEMLQSLEETLDEVNYPKGERTRFIVLFTSKIARHEQLKRENDGKKAEAKCRSLILDRP